MYQSLINLLINSGNLSATYSLRSLHRLLVGENDEDSLLRPLVRTFVYNIKMQTARSLSLYTSKSYNSFLYASKNNSFALAVTFSLSPSSGVF